MRILSCLIVVSLLVGCVGASQNISFSPNWNSQEAGLPPIKADNLLGDTVALPEDVNGARTLLIVGFSHAQKECTKEWLRKADTIAKSNQEFLVYRLAVIEPSSFLLRTIIRNGMRRGILEEAERARMLTVFTESATFAKSLGFENVAECGVVMLDKSGQIAWRAQGPFTSILESQIIAYLQSNT